MGIKTAPEVQQKAPSEVVIRTMDFSNEMDTGETISSVTITITPGGVGALTLDSRSYEGQKVTMQFSGGVAGARYEVLCAILTSSGQSIHGVGQMEVYAA